MSLLCDVCGAPNRPLVRWCHVCGHRIGEPNPTPLPTVDDLTRDERDQWIEALDEQRAVTARVVGSYLLGGWFGWHRFAIEDQLGGVIRALAASIALLSAFGLDVVDPRYVVAPVVGLGVIWLTDAPFLPRLLRQYRREARRRFFVMTWRARREAEKRRPGAAPGRDW